MKNIAFDLYGTLVDIHTDESAPHFIQNINRFVKERFDVADFFRQYHALCKKLPANDEDESDLFRLFVQILGSETDAAIVATQFRNLSRDKLQVYRGVTVLLHELRAQGIHLYLLSNAQSCFTHDELKALQLDSCFDGIELSSDFGKKKPSMQFFEHLLLKYSLDKNETLYVGNDLNADIRGAKRAGMKAAYIHSNLSPADDTLAQAKRLADFVTDKFEALSEYLAHFYKIALPKLPSAPKRNASAEKLKAAAAAMNEYLQNVLTLRNGGLIDGCFSDGSVEPEIALTTDVLQLVLRGYGIHNPLGQRQGGVRVKLELTETIFNSYMSEECRLALQNDCCADCGVRIGEKRVTH